MKMQTKKANEKPTTQRMQHQRQTAKKETNNLKLAIFLVQVRNKKIREKHVCIRAWPYYIYMFFSTQNMYMCMHTISHLCFFLLDLLPLLYFIPPFRCTFFVLFLEITHCRRPVAAAVV